MSGPRAMPRPEAAALLAVAEDADAAEVQRAFLRAARRVHPDVLVEAGDTERRAAAEAFVRLSQARDALLEPAPARPAAPVAPRAPGPLRDLDPDGGPVFRRVPGRGLGGSLVVLALLAFLLIALVSFEQAVQGEAFDTPQDVPASSSP